MIDLNEVRSLIAEEKNWLPILSRYESLHPEAKLYLKAEINAMGVYAFLSLLEEHTKGKEEFTISHVLDIYKIVEKYNWFFDSVDLHEISNYMDIHLDSMDSRIWKVLGTHASSEKRALNMYIASYIKHPAPILKTQSKDSIKRLLDEFNSLLQNCLNAFYFKSLDEDIDPIDIKKIECYYKSMRDIIAINYLQKNKNELYSSLISFFMQLKVHDQRKFIHVMIESWLGSEV